MTQWGGSFDPVYLRPANLSHEVWTAEKAAHLWALLPVYQADPEKLGDKDSEHGDVCRQQRIDLHNACMAFLSMQLEQATRHGVFIVEKGEHICTLFPHGWGHLVDRAELAGCTGTSYTYKVSALRSCSDFRWLFPGPVTWASLGQCLAQCLAMVTPI